MRVNRSANSSKRGNACRRSLGVIDSLPCGQRSDPSGSGDGALVLAAAVAVEVARRVRVAGGVAELAQGAILDLPDPLLGDRQDLADLAERVAGLAVQAEPQLQDELLAGVQRREQGVHGLGRTRRPRGPAPGRRRGARPAGWTRRSGRRRRARPGAGWPRARSRTRPPMVARSAGRGPAGAPRVSGRIGASVRGRVRGSRQGLRQPSELPGGQPDRVAAVGDGALDRLADPPGRVGRQAGRVDRVEAVDGLQQAAEPLLEQVGRRDPPVEVPPGDVRHQPRIGHRQQRRGSPRSGAPGAGWRHARVVGPRRRRRSSSPIHRRRRCRRARPRTARRNSASGRDRSHSVPSGRRVARRRSRRQSASSSRSSRSRAAAMTWASGVSRNQRRGPSASRSS